MLRYVVLTICIAAAAVCLIFPSKLPHSPISAAGGVHLMIWTAGSLERIPIDDAPRALAPVRLHAARGEYESFQLALRSSSGTVTGIRIAPTDLHGPGAAIIPARFVTAYVERYVYVDKASPTNSSAANRSLGIGWYPDGLVPLASEGASALFSGTLASSIDAGSGGNQPIWIDVFVPRDAVAGIYDGVIQVSWNDGAADIPYSVKVWNFSLPARPTLGSSFGAHAPYNTDVSTAQLLLAHRLMPRSVTALEAGPLISSGLSATALPFTSGADSGQCSMSPPPNSSDVARALQRYPGSLDPYIYSADEIDRCASVFPLVRAWGRAIHAADPRIKNLVTMTPVASLFDDGGGAGRSAVDIWVLLPAMYDAAPGLAGQALAKGDQIWSYNTLIQDTYSPKWEIDFSPINYRIQPGFLSASLSLTGILYWRIDLFTSDPWTNVSTYSDKSGVYPGEGMLIYPGQAVGVPGPLPSLRLKYLRDGEEDYEYVRLLQAAGQDSVALALSRSVAASWSNWTRDPNALESAREALGDQIEQAHSAAPVRRPQVPIRTKSVSISTHR
jgi:hypothetical protein